MTLPVGPERAHVAEKRSLFQAYRIKIGLGSGHRVSSIHLMQKQASCFPHNRLPSRRRIRPSHFQSLHGISAETDLFRSIPSRFRKRSSRHHWHLLLNVEVKLCHAVRADLSLIRALGFSLLVQHLSLCWQ
jgi:hypothetical protein